MKQDVKFEGMSESSAASGVLIAALRNVMRPFVRLLIAQGLSYPWFKEFLKGLFVDVAKKDFPIEGKEQTDSRISLLTGVHRKDVRRIGMPVRARAQDAPFNVSSGAQIVAMWIGHRDYLDAQMKPRALPRLASAAGDKASFESLVYAVSSELRPRAVLDEWLRLGVARLDEADYVHLRAEAFVPQDGFEEKAYYFGANVRDHMEAASRNLLGEEPPFLERSVHYDELSEESVAELRQLAEKLGMQTILALNRRAMELEKRDARRKSARHRMNFGVYFYTAARDDEDDARS